MIGGRPRGGFLPPTRVGGGGSVSESFDPELTTDYFDDVISAANLACSVSGGSTVTYNPNVKTPFVGYAKILNTTGDAISLYPNTAQNVAPGAGDPFWEILGDFRVDFRVAIRMAAPSAAEDYRCQIGAHDGLNDVAAIAAGVFFRACWADNGSSANWFAVSFDGSETAVDTGVAVVLNQLITFRIDYDAAPTPTATYYINGTLVATITTDLPLAQWVSHAIQIQDVAGANSEEVWLDWWRARITR